MNSLILNIATRYLAPLLVVLSLALLYRGHNLPGGGFIGGLVAASSLILTALARGWEDTVRRMRVDPLLLMVSGLIIAMLSGLPALASGLPYMTGLWLPGIDLPLLGKLKLGTPLLFDLGVYFAVIGFTIKCAISLGADESSWKS